MNNKLSTLLAQETDVNSFKTYKYCFEKVNVPTVVYDDTQEISFKKYGETECFKGYKDLTEKAKRISEYPPMFRFFLDGSRRTYKVDDVAYNNRIYPIVAGQIGVGCCERLNPNEVKVKKLYKSFVISLPECADKDGKGNLFFNNLVKKVNNHPTLSAVTLALKKYCVTKIEEIPINIE
jgi:hypothetical protein